MLRKIIFAFPVSLGLVLASLSGLPVVAQPELKFTIPGARFAVANGSHGKLTPLPGGSIRIEATTRDPLFVFHTFKPEQGGRFEATQVVVHFRASDSSLVSVEVGDPHSDEVLNAKTYTSGKLVRSPSGTSTYTWQTPPKIPPKTIGAGTVIRLGINSVLGFEGGMGTPLELIAVDLIFKNPDFKLPPASTSVKPNSSAGARVTVPSAPPASPIASIPNIPHSKGVIYTINDAYELLWYRHDGRADGSFQWAAKDASTIGHGWNFRTVIGAGDGVMYAISPEGDLIWYRHVGDGNGSFLWAQDKGQLVNSGFKGMQVVAAGHGVLYALSRTGDLLWFRHDGYVDGTDHWVARDGRVIASNWPRVQLFAGDAGTLYALTRIGDLYRFRYDGRADGSGTLPFAQGQKIASNWNYLYPFSAGEGVIYALSPEHQLLWFRDEGWGDGTVRWASTEPRVVGVGWQFRTIFSGATLKP